MTIIVSLKKNKCRMKKKTPIEPSCATTCKPKSELDNVRREGPKESER